MSWVESPRGWFACCSGFCSERCASGWGRGGRQAAGCAVGLFLERAEILGVLHGDFFAFLGRVAGTSQHIGFFFSPHHVGDPEPVGEEDCDPRKYSLHGGQCLYSVRHAARTPTIYTRISGSLIGSTSGGYGIRYPRYDFEFIFSSHLHVDLQSRLQICMP